MTAGQHSAEQRARKKVTIAQRQGGKTLKDGLFWTPCQYCGNRFRLHHLTFDHVVRKRDGGLFTYDNLVLACRLCNQAREEGFGFHFQSLIQDHVQAAR